LANRRGSWTLSLSWLHNDDAPDNSGIRWIKAGRRCSALKKRILRTVLEEIVAEVRPDNSATLLRLNWRGGVHTELVVPRNKMGHHRHTTNKNVLEVTRELAKICDDRAIASILNRLGYRTGHGKTWIASRVALAQPL